MNNNTDETNLTTASLHNANVLRIDHASLLHAKLLIPTQDMVATSPPLAPFLAPLIVSSLVPFFHSHVLDPSLAHILAFFTLPHQTWEHQPVHGLCAKGHLDV